MIEIMLHAPQARRYKLPVSCFTWSSSFLLDGDRPKRSPSQEEYNLLSVGFLSFHSCRVWSSPRRITPSLSLYLSSHFNVALGQEQLHFSLR